MKKVLPTYRTYYLETLVETNNFFALIMDFIGQIAPNATNALHIK